MCDRRETFAEMADALAKAQAKLAEVEKTYEACPRCCDSYFRAGEFDMTLKALREQHAEMSFDVASAQDETRGLRQALQACRRAARIHRGGSRCRCRARGRRFGGRSGMRRATKCQGCELGSFRTDSQRVTATPG